MEVQDYYIVSLRRMGRREKNFISIGVCQVGASMEVQDYYYVVSLRRIERNERHERRMARECQRKENRMAGECQKRLEERR